VPHRAIRCNAAHAIVCHSGLCPGAFAALTPPLALLASLSCFTLRLKPRKTGNLPDRGISVIVVHGISAAIPCAGTYATLQAVPATSVITVVAAPVRAKHTTRPSYLRRTRFSRERKKKRDDRHNMTIPLMPSAVIMSGERVKRRSDLAILPRISESSGVTKQLNSLCRRMLY
jgi:hypothetical protein